MNLLVAADTKETTGLNEKIVFAGDWFKSNTNFEKKFSHRKYSFFKYNFKNSKSYKKYILDLRSRITGELVTQLNKIHKIKIQNVHEKRVFCTKKLCPPPTWDPRATRPRPRGAPWAARPGRNLV